MRDLSTLAYLPVPATFSAQLAAVIRESAVVVVRAVGPLLTITRKPWLAISWWNSAVLVPLSLHPPTPQTMTGSLTPAGTVLGRYMVCPASPESVE